MQMGTRITQITRIFADLRVILNKKNTNKIKNPKSAKEQNTNKL